MPKPKSCFWSHNWTKWGEIITMTGTKHSMSRDKSIPFTRQFQERKCEDCGMIERREVEMYA